MLTLAFTWSEFFQQVIFGLAIGAVYASLALAIVLIYRTTHVVNFAQGEMATFTTYIAWTLTANHGWSFWPAFFATIVIAFVLGAATERVIIRPFERGDPLTLILVTIALFVIFNGLVQWIWGPEQKAFLGAFSPKPFTIGGVAISHQDVGVIAVTLVTVIVLWLFFRFTKMGLAMRAAAIAPVASRLMGVRVGWMYAAGWGFAASLGAVVRDDGRAGCLLNPSMMQIGARSMRSRRRCSAGSRAPSARSSAGSLLGLFTTLLGAYVSLISVDLELPIAFTVLILVLLFRPAGLLGQHVARRV